MEIELSRTAINRALPKVSDGVRKYTWLQTELRRRDVSCDREYQKCFNGFYRVRRNLLGKTSFTGFWRGASLAALRFQTHC